MKILVAEDDAIMMATIQYQLKKEGYEVNTANNGREAMLAFEQEIPDLVITDIIMPYTSGLEFIGFIRSAHNPIPVLVLSALDEEDTVLEAFNLGADDFLTKPVKPGELSVRVKRLLKKAGKLS
jgi:DNA-binding response OmpR family regulator